MNRIAQRVARSLALACLPVLAFGVVIQQENGDVGAKQKQKTTMYLDNGKIRVESESATGGKTVLIFDGDKQVMWMIQPAENSYSEMTADTIAGLGQQMGAANAQMADAMKKMQDQMASMPPQQRAMMEQMMKGRGGMGMPGAAAPAAPRVITFEAKGATDKVGSFTCSKYDELTDGKRTAEVCAASFDQVYLKDSDLKSLQGLRRFFEPLSRMSPRGGFSAPNTEQLKGFPVHTVGYDGDKPTFESTVLSVEQKSIDASLFTLPAGLQKRDVMGGRGGRGPF